jgi:hypothetical protein
MPSAAWIPGSSKVVGSGTFVVETTCVRGRGARMSAEARTVTALAAGGSVRSSLAAPCDSVTDAGTGKMGQFTHTHTHMYIHVHKYLLMICELVKNKTKTKTKKTTRCISTQRSAARSPPTASGAARSGECGHTAAMKRRSAS